MTGQYEGIENVLQSHGEHSPFFTITRCVNQTLHKSPLELRWPVSNAKITAPALLDCVYIGIRDSVHKAIVTVPEKNAQQRGCGSSHYDNYWENYGNPNIL